jgi:fido (protein-threonine AMPylation protein)
MSKRSEIQLEKDQILAALAAESRYMTPKEIMQSAGLTLKSHIVRDRLKELINEGNASRKGAAKGTKYTITKAYVTAALSARPKIKAEDRGQVTVQLPESAQKVQEYVSAPLTSRHNVGYKREFLDRYQPNRSSYLTAEEKEALQNLGQVDDQVQPAGTYARKILNRLLIDLSFNSSRLEGNTYSLLDTERLIQDGTPAAGKDPQETQMILNHKGAIEFLTEPVDQVGFNRFTITNLHAYLSENLLGNPAAEGRLRTIPVEIGQSVYMPAAIPQLIEECFDSILSKADEIQDPFEQAFFVSVQIPYLQPFEDVNKRVSRLAANIPLFSQNFCPMSFTDVPKRLYIEGLLGVYELNDISLFKEVFKWAYRRSASRYKVIQESLGVPDPLYLKYRDVIKQTVRHMVESRTYKSGVSEKLNQLLDGKVSAKELSEVINAVERDLISLHEGNIARFNIRLDDFRQWSTGWQNPGKG